MMYRLISGRFWNIILYRLLIIYPEAIASYLHFFRIKRIPRLDHDGPFADGIAGLAILADGSIVQIMHAGIGIAEVEVTDNSDAIAT